MVKLYLPYGNLKHLHGNRDITFHWFVKDRREPVAPYEQLLENYKQLTPEGKLQAQRMVDELFSEEEFKSLRTFLYEKYREDVRTGILVPPINGIRQDIGPNRALVRPFAACPDDESGGFCRLSEKDGYALPFSVWGYYTEPLRTRRLDTAHR